MTVLRDNRQQYRRGETIPVLTAESKMLTLFWLDVLCSLVDLHRCLRGAYCLTVLITEAVSASETSVKVYKATRCNMPEDSQLQDWTVVSAAWTVLQFRKGIVASEINATMWCKVIVATTWLKGTGYFVAHCSRDTVANNELQCQCRKVMKDGTDKTWSIIYTKRPEMLTDVWQCLQGAAQLRLASVTVFRQVSGPWQQPAQTSGSEVRETLWEMTVDFAFEVSLLMPDPQ